MLLSIGLNYVFGVLLQGKSERARKVGIGLCIGLNLLLLGYFKYANFFVQVFNDLFSFAGWKLQEVSNVHLPIGISFFTFQAMSYVIDVYRGEVKAQKNPLSLALYVSLFPQLIAGPIVRYTDVANEIDKRTHSWQQFAYGVERFVFGLAKKVLIANQVAYYVDKIFAIPGDQLSTSLVWLAVVGYAIQIYFDFSAYSDMAIGLGRMLGFRFLENFNYPYIALSIQEFWRRWHISLSTWFRDYVYIPLGGNRGGSIKTYRNLFIVFLLTGLWHGASYNFIIWGLLHGLFITIERAGFSNILKRLPVFLQSAYVLLVVLIGWVFFRANTLPEAVAFLTKMFHFTTNPAASAHFEFLVDLNFVLALVAGIVLSMPLRRLIFSDCFYDGEPTLRPRFIIYNAIIVTVFGLSIIYLAAGTYNPFIYFRF